MSCVGGGGIQQNIYQSKRRASVGRIVNEKPNPKYQKPNIEIGREIGARPRRPCIPDRQRAA